VLLYPDHFGPARGHGHEMLWGYTVAVIAGFLLTAVRNWSGRPTAHGWGLMALCALWLAGRILPWLGAWVPGRWIAGVDLAFLPVRMAVLAVPLWQARNRRNYAVLALLGLLWLGNLGMHAEALGLASTAEAGWRAGLAGVLLLITLIGGR